MDSSQPTAGASMPVYPTFDDWYQAVNGWQPFPWQRRLARSVAETGRWPSQIAVPTGLGKTACVDIAVWALARQADLDPGLRTAPTRIWWVVNRRILVDDTYRHTTRIGDLLDASAPSSSAVAAVAARLRSMHALGGPPLQTLRLRGGESHGRPRHPAQPAVVCSTIPMFGSRLLFRGYGTSRSMRPVDAALAGTDSLVLIDEAHLAAPLRTLLKDLGMLGRRCGGLLPAERSAPQAVALTATGDPDDDSFVLDSDDQDHPKVAKRLAADKPLTVEQTDKKPAAALAAAAQKLLAGLGPTPRPSAAVLVFANTPDTALAAAQQLRKTQRKSSPADVLVATGRTRGAEAVETAAEIARRLDPARSPDNGDGPDTVVVATQTLEVGADLDADYLITEACGTRALTQRLGRLNRFGRRPWARATYIHTQPRKDIGWPVYGQEPAHVLDKLTATAENGSVDMSPARITDVLGPPQDHPQTTPALADAMLQEWAKTSAPPPGEAPVEPYFAGITDPDHDIEVLWRAHLPGNGERIWPRVSDIETVPVALSAARETLNGVRCVRVGPDQETAETIPQARSGPDLRPGDTVIVAAGAGMLDTDGHWRTDAPGPALDRSIEHAGLPLAPDTLDNLYADPPRHLRAALKRLLGSHDEDDPDAATAAAEAFLGALSALPPLGHDPTLWQRLTAQAHDTALERTARGQPVIVAPANETPRLPLPGPARTTARSDEHDELCIAAPETLQAHSELTARTAAQILTACGVAPRRVRDITELSARLHDIGKADPRFQLWLDPHAHSRQLLAKSNVAPTEWQHTRRAAGWPAGGRHEELSRRLTMAWLRDGDDLPTEIEEHGDLLMHLIVAHHGRGRPLVEPVTDRTATTVAYQIDGTRVESPADLDITDWHQPARFAALNERYGYWGLAMLEATVRQADHLASAPGTEIR